jgi:sugar phosphate isomerase/epimerase
MNNIKSADQESKTPAPFTFETSLAEWSFAGDLMSGKMSNMEFPSRAKNECGIDVVEYVSSFFNEQHTRAKYLRELKQRCDDLGVKSNLIMVDGGNIAALNKAEREMAVEEHFAWVDAAKFLGCNTIRVNLGDVKKILTSEPDDPAQAAAAAAVEGYRELLEYASTENINVVVENHFGNSTDADWLVGIIQAVNMSNAGLLPDFGNFCAQRTIPETNDWKGIMKTQCIKKFDRYEGVRKMMPYAKGVSAKSHRFDATGNDTGTDYFKMFSIIREFDINGFVGIEYAGSFGKIHDPESTDLPAVDGILATKKLLDQVRAKFSQADQQ